MVAECSELSDLSDDAQDTGMPVGDVEYSQLDTMLMGNRAGLDVDRLENPRSNRTSAFCGAWNRCKGKLKRIS